jgi:hypothetical protein
MITISNFKLRHKITSILLHESSNYIYIVTYLLTNELTILFHNYQLTICLSTRPFIRQYTYSSIHLSPIKQSLNQSTHTAITNRTIHLSIHPSIELCHTSYSHVSHTTDPMNLPGAVKFQIVAIWFLMPCRDMIGYRRFGRHLLPSDSYLVLKAEATWSSETSVPYHITKWTHCRENVKSHISVKV